MMSIWEAGMLICFGLAWPINIYKSITSRSTKGKSGFFLVVVLIGYICGIANKLLFSFDMVLWLYVLNFTMIFIDLILFFWNRQRERRQESEATH